MSGKLDGWLKEGTCQVFVRTARDRIVVQQVLLLCLIKCRFLLFHLFIISSVTTCILSFTCLKCNFMENVETNKLRTLQSISLYHTPLLKVEYEVPFVPFLNSGLLCVPGVVLLPSLVNCKLTYRLIRYNSLAGDQPLLTCTFFLEGGWMG